MTGRQAAVVIAKLVFACAIIWWLMHKVDAGRVWTSIREAHRGPIVLGVLLCMSTVLVAGWRWQKLLMAIGLAVPLTATIAIAQIGQFFMVFLPGPTGDDLTRMLYISRIAKGRIGEACTTVLLDRLIGLASVLGLALVCIPSQWALMNTTRQSSWLAWGMVMTGAVVCGSGILFFVLRRERIERIHDGLLGFFPEGKLRRQFHRMGHLLVFNRPAVASVIAAAMGTQLILCLVYWLAGRAVGLAVPLSLWMSFVPIVLAANAVPLTIAGLGVREYLLVLFLGVVGHIEGEKALAASLVVFAVTLAACLFGGVVYIFYRPKPESPIT
jgi:uncharacterized protein (TIRG00374 family)